MPLVDLVKLGFLGFSVAVLLLSFFLLQKIMTSSSYEGDNLLIRCKQVHRFMLMSIAVIIIGMTWELASRLIKPQIDLVFDISPNDKELLENMTIKVGKSRIDMSKEEDVQVKDGEEITIDVNKLDRKVRDMAKEIERYAGVKNQLNILQQQKASEEFESAAKEAGI